MPSLKPFVSALVLLVGATLIPLAAWTAEQMSLVDTYMPSINEIMNAKATFDDKRDPIVSYHPKNVLPPEVWKWTDFDVAKMKEMTAEIIGFTGPELVGKIASEIKPGKYTYKDMAKYPGIKELLPPVYQKTIKSGGPPHICNIMDFEIEPTRQLHWSLPVCEATKRNMGKTRLDEDGYLVPRTWEGGIPFPRPSGRFKAQQIYYNFEKRSTNYEECYYLTGEGFAFDRNLKVDKHMKYARSLVKLMGRALFPPFGWFDKRAEKRGEYTADAVEMLEPRSNRGMVTMLLRYDDPYKMDPTMIYLPQMRRIRKMSSTDTQDPLGDMSYDDVGYIRQKITPKRYPYDFDIIDEREYLFPFAYNSAKSWIDSKNGYALRDLGLMRRPSYVLQMTQTDPNYVYGKRVYYIDKETFAPGWAEFYDQKGRLYRTYDIARVFIPETGQILSHGTPSWQVDYVDTHSSCQLLIMMPASFSRRHFNMENLIKRGK